jgi:hypothetical protein
LQGFHKSRNALLTLSIIRPYMHEYADTPQWTGLLCVCPKRPRGDRATEKLDELAPSHCRPRSQGTIA